MDVNRDWVELKVVKLCDKEGKKKLRKIIHNSHNLTAFQPHKFTNFVSHSSAVNELKLLRIVVLSDGTCRHRQLRVPHPSQAEIPRKSCEFFGKLYATCRQHTSSHSTIKLNGICHDVILRCSFKLESIFLTCHERIFGVLRSKTKQRRRKVLMNTKKKVEIIRIEIRKRWNVKFRISFCVDSIRIQGVWFDHDSWTGKTEKKVSCSFRLIAL